MQNCPECERLWHEYGVATSEHVALETQLRSAASGRAYDQIESLTLRAEKAGELRSSIREAIRQHESAAHAKAATNDR